jgi:hypothetical protein
VWQYYDLNIKGPPPKKSSCVEVLVPNAMIRGSLWEVIGSCGNWTNQ